MLAYTVFRSGQFPNIKDYLFYQGIFYGNGFYMMPMPFFHPWNLVILVYLTGIIQSVFYFAGRLPSDQPVEPISNPDHRKRMLVFILSILGVGLFGYYQGRSHPIVLTAVLWPALLLIAIYLDDLGNLLVQLKAINLSKQFNMVAGLSILYSCLVFLFFSFGTATLINAPQLIGYLFSQYSPQLSNYPPNFQSKIDFINAHTGSDEQVPILAINSGILYAETNVHNPLPIPGITELMTKVDLLKIIAYINDPTTNKIFVELEILARYPGLAYSLLNSRLKMTAEDRLNHLMLYSDE